jgi:O-antigen ligase
MDRVPDRVRRLRARLHLLLPALLTALFAFRSGGFFPAATGVAAFLLLVFAVGRITVARRPFAGWSPALAVCAGAWGLLATWTLLSAVWSDAPLRSMLEFDRVLAYTLIVALVGSFARGRGDLDRALAWVALALCAIAAIALATRLEPGALPISAGAEPSRLAFPYTYWNAAGVGFALGLVLALHVSAGGTRGWWARVLAAAACPVAAVALYFTFSRGALGAAAVGTVLYVVLAHSRRLATTLLAIGAPTAIAVVVAYDADVLATAEYAEAGSEATRVTLVVLACALGAAVLRAAALPLERRLLAVRVSRPARRYLLLGATAGAVAVVAVAAIATPLGSEIDDRRREFSESQFVTATPDQRTRLTQASANGRIESWRIARDTFEREPVTGTGAGTYQLEWQRERSGPFNLIDAHSLYLETLAELGVPGMLLLAVALLTPMGLALARLRGPERHAYAAFLAAGTMLLLHAAIDWDWEMPALFAWFLGCGGIVCAARRRRKPGPEPRRTTRLVAGLACLFVAVTPATVVLSQARLDDATRAFKVDDCATAVDASLGSVSALNVRPEPFELIGYCDLRAGQDALAVRAMESARTRDPQDWQYAYGLAVARAFNGQDPRPMAALARRLNPQEPLARELDEALRRSGPGRWPRVAARARIPSQ